MSAYATLDDVQARYRQLSDSEKTRTVVLLDDATDLIQTSCNGATTATAATLKRICCMVVIRALQSQQSGISQQSQTTGPFSMSLSYANPSGDLYLTRAERMAINGRQQVFSAKWGGDHGAD